MTVAATPEAARAAAERKQDLLICDLRLQGTDGTRLALELSAKDPDMGVLLVSGQEDVSRSDLPARFGFLRKPFPLKDLDKCLRTILETQQAK